MPNQSDTEIITDRERLFRLGEADGEPIGPEGGTVNDLATWLEEDAGGRWSLIHPAERDDDLAVYRRDGDEPGTFDYSLVADMHGPFAVAIAGWRPSN